MGEKIPVAVVGTGTVGDRIAKAVRKQDDMELVCVAKKNRDSFYEALKREGIEVYTDLEQLLGKMNELGGIVVDATPKDVGKENKKIYEGYDKIKAYIFQGGEKEDIGLSFNSYVTPFERVSAHLEESRYFRVVSCNTTGILRIISPFLDDVKKVEVIITRRAADPSEDKKGPINSVIISGPSHHADDVNSVFRDAGKGKIDIYTNAKVVPTTLMHVHDIRLELKNKMEKDEVLDRIKKFRRIEFLPNDIISTSKVIEYARRYGDGNMYQVVIFPQTLNVEGNVVRWTQAIHQEAIVIPENIDLIRAISGYEKEEAIRKTDESLLK